MKGRKGRKKWKEGQEREKGHKWKEGKEREEGQEREIGQETRKGREGRDPKLHLLNSDWVLGRDQFNCSSLN